MENNEKYWAGIGSRQTPPDILNKVIHISKLLNKYGWILRSGGADGFDTAAELGAGEIKEIYLPWKNFNNNESKLFSISTEAMNIAETFHPNWNALSVGAKKLHSRNVYQILGKSLQKPVKFVLCWHNNSGGTLQACRVATAHKIPIINMINNSWKEELYKTIVWKEY